MSAPSLAPGRFVFWEHRRDKGYHSISTQAHHAKVARRGRAVDWEVWTKSRHGRLKSVARGQCTTVFDAQRVAAAVIVAREGAA